MSTNTESANMNNLSSNWIDKGIRIIEILSLVFLVVPYGSMALWILASEFLHGDYFFFFPTALFLFLPTGIFALLVQLIRIARKHPANSFNRFVLGFSKFTVFIGVFAYMLIFAVTNE